MKRQAQSPAELMVSEWLAKLQLSARTEEAGARLRLGIARLASESPDLRLDEGCAAPKSARGIRRRKTLRPSDIGVAPRLKSGGRRGSV